MKLIKNYLRKIFLPIIFLLFLILNYLLLFIPNIILKRKNIYTIIFHGFGIGDMLVFSSAIEYLNKKENVAFNIYSSHPEIFSNLKGIVKNKLIKKNYFSKILYYFFESSVHSNIISYFGGNLYFKRYGPKYKSKNSYYGNIMKENKLYLLDVFLFPRKDFLKKIAGRNKKPIINFSIEEIKIYEKKYFNLLKKPFVVTASGTSNEIKSKSISIRKMDKIIKEFNKKINWVQLGTLNDKKLNEINVDLRGKTSLRELFYLISKSKFTFVNEGLITHVSAAFDIPSISIYTGYHYPEISSYKTTIPMVPKILPFCAYCFKKTCKYTKKGKAKCSSEIDLKEIIKKINSLYLLTKK